MLFSGGAGVKVIHDIQIHKLEKIFTFGGKQTAGARTAGKLNGEIR